MEAEAHPYILAIASNDGVDLLWDKAISHLPASEVATHALHSWQRVSAGEGSKGVRWYDWEIVPLAAPSRQGWGRWLLVRRSIAES